MSDYEPEDRQQQVLSAVMKFLAIAAGLGLVIGIATWVIVKQLDLNANDNGSVGSPSSEPSYSALPSSALPNPTASEEPTDEPTELDTEDPLSLPSSIGGAPTLSASPAVVGSMERINLTGQWAGQDSVSLLVQRFEDGDWVDFGVQVQVRLGSFATYVKTAHEGPNKFRVYDPDTQSASNAVTIDVSS